MRENDASKVTFEVRNGLAGTVSKYAFGLLFLVSEPPYASPAIRYDVQVAGSSSPRLSPSDGDDGPSGPCVVPEA